MRVEVLQRWTTIQGTASAGGTVDVLQEHEDWLDAGNACDLTAQVDVKAVSAVLGGTLTLYLGSAPKPGNEFFMPIVGLPFVAAASSPYVLSTLAGGAVSVGPLAKHLRWKVVSSTGSGVFSITFKVRVALSQTPYFAPTQIPGCVAWFRADLGANLSGLTTTVSTWTDQSSTTSSNLLTASGTPTYVPATATSLTSPFAGYPTLAFAAANSDFLAVNPGVVLTQPNTVVLVGSIGGSLATAQALFCGSSVTNQGLTIPASSTTTLTLNAGTAQTVTLPTALTTPSILEVDWNAASSAVYQNGQAVTLGGSPGTHGLTFGTVGALPSGSDFLTGNIAEVIVYNHALTTAQRTLLTRYLGARYGIVVP